MSMTREKMLEIQGEKPSKRYFTLNRKVLVERAEKMIVVMVRAGKGSVDHVWHPWFAPLTREELKDARDVAREILNQKVSKPS